MKTYWGFLAVLLLLFTGQARAQSEPISIAAYWERIDSIQASLENDTAVDKSELMQIADQLESIRIVQLNDGTEIRVDHTYISGLLRTDPPQIDKVLNILQSAQSANVEVPNHISTSNDLNALDEILSGKAYQWEDQSSNPIYELWLRFTNWILRLVSQIFPSVEGARTVINASLVVALGTALVLIFSFVYRSMLRNVAREAEFDPIQGEIRRLTADQALRQARTLAQNGDRRNAVRYLYISMLLSMIENGLLSAEKTRTNNEILNELLAKQDLSEKFKKITKVFDRVWYGLHTINKEDYEAYASQVEHFLSLKGAEE